MEQSGRCFILRCVSFLMADLLGAASRAAGKNWCLFMDDLAGTASRTASKYRSFLHCTAYAYANFHQEFLKGKVALIGCPKLDDVDYSEKLAEIIKENDIQSVTIVRMEVPCCGGLQHAAMTAIQNSGKFIPWQVVTISIDGKILNQAF